MKSSLLANTNEKKSENNLPLLLSVILFSDQLSHYISKIRKVNAKSSKKSHKNAAFKTNFSLKSSQKIQAKISISNYHCKLKGNYPCCVICLLTQFNA